jgi:hypothetical protein
MMFTALCAMIAGVVGFLLAAIPAGRYINAAEDALDEAIGEAVDARDNAETRVYHLTTRIRHAKSMDTPKSNATVKRILRALDGE